MLSGYLIMENIINDEDLIKRFAYQAYQIRIRCGLTGDATSDWFDGVKMYKDYCLLHDVLERKL